MISLKNTLEAIKSKIANHDDRLDNFDTITYYDNPATMWASATCSEVYSQVVQIGKYAILTISGNGHNLSWNTPFAYMSEHLPTQETNGLLAVYPPYTFAGYGLITTDGKIYQKFGSAVNGYFSLIFIYETTD